MVCYVGRYMDLHLCPVKYFAYMLGALLFSPKAERSLPASALISFISAHFCKWFDSQHVHIRYNSLVKLWLVISMNMRNRHIYKINGVQDLTKIFFKDSFLNFA